MHMWQSHVENEHYSYHILTTTSTLHAVAGVEAGQWGGGGGGGGPRPVGSVRIE